MKKTIYYIFVLCAVCCGIISCAKEDDLTPNGANEDYFTVPADATDPISVMRREFYDENKVHLLFNDTLRHEQRGTYADGSPFWYTEIVDLNWFITTSTDDEIVMDYLTDNYREVAEFAKEYILKHLQGDFKPYSILLADQLYSIDANDEEDIDEEDYCNGLRCLAISAGNIIGMDDAGKVYFSQSILSGSVFSKLEDLVDEPQLEAFTTFSQDYYRQYFRDIDGLKDLPFVTQADLYPYGFLSKNWSSCPDRADDLESYVEAMFEMEEEEFKETYDYPIIHQKYDALKKIITEFGFKF